MSVNYTSRSDILWILPSNNLAFISSWIFNLLISSLSYNMFWFSYWFFLLSQSILHMAYDSFWLATNETFYNYYFNPKHSSCDECKVVWIYWNPFLNKFNSKLFFIRLDYYLCYIAVSSCFFSAKRVSSSVIFFCCSSNMYW